MTLVRWQDEYSTGSAAVDFEHKELIDLINALYAAIQDAPDKSNVGAFLGEIHARISAHFALEERLMRDRDYVEFAEHKADHEELLDEIRDIMDEAGGAQADFSEVLAKKLADWFSTHFSTFDARLHRQL